MIISWLPWLPTSQVSLLIADDTLIKFAFTFDGDI